MRDLILEMISRNGILPVQVLSSNKLKLGEDLVERGTLDGATLQRSVMLQQPGSQGGL